MPLDFGMAFGEIAAGGVPRSRGAFGGKS